MAIKWGFKSMAYVASLQNPRVRASGVLRTAFAAIVLFQFSASSIFQAHASEGTIIDFPFLIHCEAGGVDRAYYLSKIDPNGVAVFVSPDRLAGTITIKGKAEPVGGEGSGTCAGKTLEQLRSTGQAFYLLH